MRIKQLFVHAVCVAGMLAVASSAGAGAYEESGDREEAPVAAPVPMSEPEEDGWTFVITPQLWIPHIDSGGFSGGSAFTASAGSLAPAGANARFNAANLDALDPVDLQWGFQLAAQKGRWTIGASYQSTDFETRSDINYSSSTDTTLFIDDNGNGSVDDGERRIEPGDFAGNEYVNTSRTDVDLAVSYLVPNVVPNVLSLAIGGGLKMIYADSVRTYANLDDVLAFVDGQNPPGLYVKCKGDPNCDNGIQLFDRVKSTTWMYGVTIPISAITRLNDDGTWLLPISVAPFLGAETRQDHNVIYALNADNTVDRQDGTYFAYGVTADATLRVALTDTLWAYGGMRVQYMNGDSPDSDAYLAYGPLLGISASFTPN